MISSSTIKETDNNSGGVKNMMSFSQKQEDTLLVIIDSEGTYFKSSYKNKEISNIYDLQYVGFLNVDVACL